MKFLWTTLHVKNMDESLKFYTEIVDLKVMNKIEFPDGRKIVFLGEGETQIELIYSEEEIINIGESISVGFEVDSLDEMMETVAKHNISIQAGPIQPSPFIKFFYVLDPNGLKVQFVQKIKQ